MSCSLDDRLEIVHDRGTEDTGQRPVDRELGPPIDWNRLAQKVSEFVVILKILVEASVALPGSIEYDENDAWKPSPDSTVGLDILRSAAGHSLEDHEVELVDIDPVRDHVRRRNQIDSILKSSPLKHLQYLPYLGEGHISGQGLRSKFTKALGSELGVHHGSNRLTNRVS